MAVPSAGGSRSEETEDLLPDFGYPWRIPKGLKTLVPRDLFP